MADVTSVLIFMAAIFVFGSLSIHLATVMLGALRALRAVPPDRRAETVQITIVRPVCGIEAFSEKTLASSFHLAHANYDVVFCAARSNDPIIPIVERLMRAHPHVPSRLLIGKDPVSTNPKLNNCVKGWRAAQAPWIVMADSNVMMPPDYLSSLVLAWRRDTGLVCSPPLGSDPNGFAAELECQWLNTYQLRWQLFADALGFGFAQGKTMLFRRDLLDSLGGVTALGHEAAEDAAATKLVRGAGLHVRLVARPFRQPIGSRSLRQVWDRQLRWARLRRDSFLGGFVAEIVAGGLPTLTAAAAAMTMAGWDGDVILAALSGVAALWYGAEAALALIAGWHFTVASVAACVLRDMLLPVLWVSAWLGNGFVWHGQPIDIARVNSTEAS